MQRILLVDADATRAELIGLALTRAHYDVMCPASGATALAQVSKFHPEFALIDFRLPDVSGIDVLRQLLARLPECACVIATGFGACRSAGEAMRLGAVDYLEKPIDIDQLVSLLVCVTRARSCTPTTAMMSPTEAHALNRWADLVLGVLDSPTDSHTLAEWGRA